ncbi:MAG TPA: PBP1A family penicillin-binding protein, partial [Longimicrobium sp.]|nr:PBP1A family penicillin-binding protein [Longimicrobium sp.]
IEFHPHLWRERAREGWTRLRGAWRNRQERKIVIGLAALSLASCGTGGMVAAWTRACAGTCPTAETIENFAPRQASLVLDARGGVLGPFYRERRTLIQIDSLPNHVPMAFVAIEDKRFFEHEGVDPVRIVAAVRDNIIKGWGGPGGSTISMQLARNLFPQQLPASETSVRRKVAEIKLAMQMERRFSKRRILELYLNHIYLGSGSYGVEAAARTYFGKPARQLNYVEAATIAGLPQAPSAYDPRRNPERAERRRNVVLQAMADARVITQAQADEGKQTPLALSPPGGARGAPYFVEAVRRELEDRFGELLYTGGLRIHTAIDPVLQRTAEQGLEENLRQIERGTYGGFRGPTYQSFTAGLKPGQAVTHTPYLQGIVVVLDPATGLVKALVGGRDFRQSQFNRAMQALRQPGSSFKPFVYAAALEHGRSPSSGISDGPLTINNGSESWSPKNYDGTYGGWTSLRSALRNSRNLATIRLGRETGIENVRALAARTGLGTRIPGYPSVYIGSAGVYPIDMMAAYASFANGGWRVEPQLVARVENHRGELLWAPAPAPRRAVEPGIAWILTDMLREVVDRGTGYLARDPGVGALPYEVPAAGKTGTTNDNTDVWFVGYTPDLLAGVWMGFDTPRPIMAGATGGTLAVPVWARVMRTAYANRRPPEPWTRPSDVVMRRVSGGRVLSAECGGGTPDFFAARHAPAGSCPQPSAEPQFVDPTPELPGRPVFPGQKREPRPEDFITPGAERERR